MPIRIVLYDALKSLSQGELLIKFGDSDSSLSVYLPGAPLTYMIFNDLVENEWIIPYKNNENEFVQYWHISHPGFVVYKQGVIWYTNLTLIQKLKGRIGFNI